MGAQSVWERSRTQQVRPGVQVSGGTIIQRDTINLIPGSGQTITATDNPGQKRIDLTLAIAAALGNIFYFEDFFADPTGGADSTAAIQNTIAAGYASGYDFGCTSKFTHAVYKCSGPLQDTSRGNAQILWPSVDTASATQVTCKIFSYVAPSLQPGLLVSTPLPLGGITFKSTLSSVSGTSPAFFGGWGPVTSSEDFTYVNVVLENVIFQTVANPGLTAVDMTHATACNVRCSAANTGANYVAGVTQPTTATSFGFRTPKNDNGANTYLENCQVVGFYNGYEVNEHAVLNNCSAFACVRPIRYPFGYHASYVNRFLSVWCPTPVSSDGSGIAYTQIDQLDIEHAAAGHWYSPGNDIDDASNLLYGNLRWHMVTTVTGVTHTFVKNGGTNLACVELGDNSGGGGGGGGPYITGIDPGGVAGTPYSYTLTLNNPGTAATWEVFPVSGYSGITAGMSITASTATTATISGTPTTNTTYTYMVAATATAGAPACSTALSKQVAVISAGTPVTWDATHNGGVYGFFNTVVGPSNLVSHANGSDAFDGSHMCVSTVGYATGKWYAEVLFNGAAGGNFSAIGISRGSITGFTDPYSVFHSYYQQTGQSLIEAANTLATYGNPYGNGDIIGIAWDATGGNVYFALNNVWQNSGNPVLGINPAFTGLTGIARYVACVLYADSTSPKSTGTARFRTADFTYTPPTGYSAWGP